MIMKSEIRNKLKNKLPSVGSWMQIPDQSVAEIMGNSGYDWIAVDMEHGAISKNNLPGLFNAISSGGAAPFARVARAESVYIKEALDSGAQGLILPMIETGAQLENAISEAHYPPLGNRGIGFCRANMFGKNFKTYFENENNPIIVAQIEHKRAVENMDSILKVKGLDAIMIGPYDLSGSMNMTGEFDHPAFVQVLKTIFDKALHYNIAMGLHIVAPDKQQLKNKIDEGYQFIAYGIDALFLYNSSENPEM
ncbi:MAG: 2,4-dihydroxyhept-2-ene-1,7-dioic acid aldolase [Desulfobacula sp.]|nr:2,4-dihydroxyhept-2-ene-1,7-dioic acid aldolase [Desulfobacula sp.]